MKRFPCLLLLAVLALSCSQKQDSATSQRRYFWPPPPDEPKIEFVGLYHTNRIFHQAPSVMKWLIGETDPEIKLRKPLGIASDGEGLVLVTDMVPQGGTMWDLNEKKVTYLTRDQSIQLGSGVAFEGNKIYVADAKQGVIRVLAKDTREIVYTITDDDLMSPSGVAVNEALRRLYVVDSKKCAVLVYDIDSRKKLFAFGKLGEKQEEFNRPWGVAIDKNSDVYISDGLNARVQIFNKDGKFITMFGKRSDKAGGFAQVKGIGVDSELNIYVVDPLKAVQIFNRNGELLGLLGAQGTRGVGAMYLPMGLYVDKKDRIYVVDQMNQRFHVYQYLSAEYKKKNPIAPESVK